MHVAPWGVFVTTPKASAQEATLAVQTEVLNETAAPQSVTVRTVILGPDGMKLGEAESPGEIAAGRIPDRDQSDSA